MNIYYISTFATLFINDNKVVVEVASIVGNTVSMHYMELATQDGKLTFVS